MKYNRLSIYHLTLFIGLCLLIILARFHTYDEPLERDIGVYAVIAHEMLHGRELYSDLWDHKPPAIHITFALGELLVGYGPQSVYLLNVIATLITLLGVYFAGQTMSQNRSGGLWAAIFWVIVSSDLRLQANQPNVEVFINACLIWAFTLILRAEQSLAIAKVIIIGLLFAIASLYKQVTLMATIAFCTAYLIFRPTQVTLKKAWIHLILMAIIDALAWGFVIGYFTVMGRFDAFYEAVFTYNQEYINLVKVDSQGKMNLISGIFNSFPLRFTSILPLFILSIIGLAIGLLKKKHLWFYLLAYFIAAPLMIALPNQFFPHYYQLWLPVLSVAAGVTVIELGSIFALAREKWRYFNQLVGATLVVALLSFQIPSFQLSAEEWAFKKYGGIFNQAKRVAAIPKELLLPGETFYQFGAETTLYFYSQRSPGAGLFFFYPLLHPKFTEKFSQRVIADLERNKPELVMFGLPALDQHGNPLIPFFFKSHPFVAWVPSRYQPLPELLHPALWVRIGGKLEERLLSKKSR